MSDHKLAEALRDAQEQPFEDWWEREGQFARSGGGQYEKTFAWNAWCAALAVHEAEQQAGEAVALQPLSDEYKPDALRWREAKRFRVGDESGGVGIWYEKQRVWVTGDLADSLADGQIAQRFFDEHGCWPCHASDEQLAGTDAEHLQPPYGRDRGITKDTK